MALRLAPVQINKRRRPVIAMPPPPSPSALSLVRALVSLSRLVATGDKPRGCQKRNASNITRRIELLSPFFEEIQESRPPLPPSAVLAFRELHMLMQRASMLLDACMESSSFWLLMQHESYAQQFQELTQNMGSALQAIPFELLDLSDEVREQTELVRMQVLRAKLCIDPAEIRLLGDVGSFLQQVERKEAPDRFQLQKLFSRLQLLSARDCEVEIQRLEEAGTLTRNDTNTSTLNGLPSLISFVRYAKYVLYSTESSKQQEVSQSEAAAGSRVCGEVSTTGRDAERSLLLCPPDEFLCPISLDLMRDPVIVATGQTYDRTSISRWLDAGNQTCPKSGQKLTHVSLIPNYALRSLISQWCEDNNVPFERTDGRSKKGTGADNIASTRAALEATKLTAAFLVGKLITGTPEVQKQIAYELRLLAKCGMENRMCIADAGGIPLLVPLLSSSDPRTQENAVTALLNLSIYESNKNVIMAARALDPIIEVLKAGQSMESRENAAATLFSLSVVDDLKVQIGNKPDAIPALCALLRDGSARRGKKDAATALFNLAVYHGNKLKIIAAGAVPVLVSLLHDDTGALADDCLAVLALLAAFTDGVVAISETDPIPVLVNLLRSGTPKAKEHAVAVLLALCKTADTKIVNCVLQISTAVPSLYNVLTMGTPRAKRKARSLLKLLHRWEPVVASSARL